MLTINHRNHIFINYLKYIQSILKDIITSKTHISTIYPCFLVFACALFTFNTDIYADVSHVTTEDGITVTFKLPQLHVNKITPDVNNGNLRENIVYDTVHYSDCAWIQEPGYPKLPATRLLLAIPPDVKLNNTDISVHTGFLQLATV